MGGLQIYFQLFSVYGRALEKLGSFGFSALDLCVGKKPNVPNVRLDFQLVGN